MTPTTAAVIAVRGAVNPSLPWVDSISGPPTKIKKKEGKKVNQVATHAPITPNQNGSLAPIKC